MGFLEIGCIYGPIMLSQYLRSDHVTFIRRACLDILPTRTALVRRTTGTNPFCEFCSAAVETEVHVFFECPLFSSVWTESPFHIPYPVPATNFATGLRWLRDKLDTQVFLTGAVTLWNIWNFRNGYYHGSETGDRNGIVTRSQAFLGSYASARITFPIINVPVRQTSWEPPCRVKVHFDAATLSSGEYQVAAVGRDSSGGEYWLGDSEVSGLAVACGGGGMCSPSRAAIGTNEWMDPPSP